MKRNADENTKNQNVHTLWVEILTGLAAMDIGVGIPQRPSWEFSCHWVLIFPGIYRNNSKSAHRGESLTDPC